MTERRRKAILAMAKRGTEHEREIALKLVESNGIDTEDCESKDRNFQFTSKFERDLLHQTMAMVLNKSSIRLYETRTVCHVDLTEKEYQEISLFYEVYRRELEEELEITLRAFVQRNDIFTQEALNNPSLAPDAKALKALKRALEMDKTHVRKAITG